MSSGPSICGCRCKDQSLDPRAMKLLSSSYLGNRSAAAASYVSLRRSWPKQHASSRAGLVRLDTLQCVRVLRMIANAEVQERMLPKSHRKSFQSSALLRCLASQWSSPSWSLYCKHTTARTRGTSWFHPTPLYCVKIVRAYVKIVRTYVKIVRACLLILRVLRIVEMSF